MRRSPHLHAIAPALLFLALAAPPVRAAIANPPKEDIDFIAEHVPESAQDARWLSLTTLHGRLEAGRWETSVQAGWSETTASLFQLDGPMVSAGAGYSFRDGWAVQGLGFYDAMSFSGGAAREVLHPLFS